MTIYQSKQEFQDILSKLWDMIFKNPEITEAVAGEKLVVRFRYTDFKTDFYIDLTGDQPAYYWDPERETIADVDMILSSETSHKFWMEQLNVPLAIASRKIIAKGSIQKALKLLPALKPAFPLYPDVLVQLGKVDLLEGRKDARKRKRKWMSLFQKKRSRSFDLKKLPGFPLGHTEKAVMASDSAKTNLPDVSELDILETMFTIRHFENHLAKAFRKGDLPTEAIHLSIGQEAIAACVCLNLGPTDYINTTHRGHGHIIAKGADINTMMAELYGKATGLCQGKGGSMHVTDRSLGILGANGIVGAGYLLAMGAAFTIKQEGRKDVSVVFAGDGSVNQGMFHEAMNMASLFELPLLVVVENNLYGEFTPLEKHSAEPNLHERLNAYRIPARRLDGNDVGELYGEIADTINQIRQDGKPRMLELMTYRHHGHMEGESELYRPLGEKETHLKRDPIPLHKRRLLDQKMVTEQEIKELEDQVRQNVEDAVKFAVESPQPESIELSTRVYFPDHTSLFNGNIAGNPAGNDLSLAQAINQAISEEMTRDPRVFLWGEDVALGGYFSVTEGLIDKFGKERIIDTPISEYGIVGGAVGAAMTGMRPICEILFSDFLTCCMDPIVNQAAKLRYMTGGQVTIPLTVRTPVGAGVGMAAQHSQSMERFFFGVPGLMVVAPSDPYTAKGLLKTAIRSENPVIFFEHKLLYANGGSVPDTEYLLPLGKARIVRSGDDITIVSHLLGVGVAMDAAEMLAGEGIHAEVIDLCTLYPLDTRTILESVARTGRLATIEEGHATGGIGAEIIARVTTAGHGLLNATPLRFAAPECPIPYAKNLENEMIPDPGKIAESILKQFE